MKGKLENGRTFEMTPDWLKSWEQENGNKYHCTKCMWSGAYPVKSTRPFIDKHGIEVEDELRCPECGEKIVSINTTE